jgi:hypothetical protein
VVTLVLRYAGWGAWTVVSRASGFWVVVVVVVVVSVAERVSARPSSASIDHPRLDSMHAVQKSPKLGTLLWHRGSA